MTEPMTDNRYTNLAKSLYPDARGPWDYGPLLATFGEILVKIDDDDYQGDSRILYRNGSRYGVLVFGWGSCSGCDSLQACGTHGEIGQLIKRLGSDVKWFESLEDAKRYVADDASRSLSYYFHEQKEWQEFRNAVLECRHHGE